MWRAIKSGSSAWRLFFILLTIGGVWAYTVANWPDRPPYNAFMFVCGGTFTAMYVVLLLARVRHLLDSETPFKRTLAALLGDLSLLILAFAWAQSQLGMLDNSREDRYVSYNFFVGIYYSIVTFTTLGYGDIYPMGIGRAFAAMEALVGYFVLATLASTALTILSPHQPPHVFSDREEPKENP